MIVDIPNQIYLRCKFQQHATTAVKQRKTKLIFCLDCSGSMAGGPWTSVSTAMKQVKDNYMTLCGNDAAKVDEMCSVIMYNEYVTYLSLTEFTGRLRSAGGGTSFSNLYIACRGLVEKEHNSSFPPADLVFVIMSDGEDNGVGSTLSRAEADLKIVTSNDKLQFTTCFHAVGFNQVHEAIMTRALHLGSVKGLLRYSNSSAIIAQDMMDTWNVAQTMTTLQMLIVNPYDPRSVYAAPIMCHVHDDGDEDSGSGGNISISSGNSGNNNRTGTWYAFETLIDTMELELRLKVPLTQCAMRLVQPNDGKKVIASLPEITAFASPTALEYLSALEMVELQSGKECVRLLHVISRLQMKSMSCYNRKLFEDKRRDLNARLTEYLKLFNTQGAAADRTQVRLRLQALASEHVFTKGRLNRVVQIRNEVNTQNLKRQDNELLRLHRKFMDPSSAAAAVERKQVAEISATAEFVDIIDLTTLDELMTSEDQYDNILGIGIMLERTELAVESPQIGVKLLSVSSSIISYRSYTDAFQRAVAEKGGDAAHGGFTSHAGAAYCCVGAANERINGFLPLYIHKAHYARVRASMRNWLSNICLVDPYLYSKNQEPVVLGMIAQLMQQNEFYTTAFGKRITSQLEMVAFEMMNHGTWFKDEAVVTNMSQFVTAPQARQAAHFQTLDVPLMMTYLKAKNNVMRIQNSDDSSNNNNNGSNGSDGESKETKTLKIITDSYARVERTLSEFIVATYYEYIKRYVNKTHAADKVKARGVVTELLYGSPTDQKHLSDSKDPMHKSSASAAGTASSISSGIEQQMISDFANWFLKPRESAGCAPTIPAVLYKTSSDANEENKDDDQNDDDEQDEMMTVRTVLEKVPDAIDTVLEHMETTRWAMRYREIVGHISSSVGFPCDLTRYIDREQLLTNPLTRANLIYTYWFYNDSNPSADTTLGNIGALVHRKMQEALDNAIKNQRLSTNLSNIAMLISHTDYLHAFAGLLRSNCPSRNGVTFNLVVRRLLQDGDVAKIKAILLNTVDIEAPENRKMWIWNDPDLANNVWIPVDMVMMEEIRNLVGQEEMDRIGGVHRKLGRARSHVYRLSNEPNRHKHSNLDPFPGLIGKFVSY